MKTLSGVPGTAQITFEYVKKQIEEELEKSKPKEKQRNTRRRRKTTMKKKIRLKFL